MNRYHLPLEPIEVLAERLEVRSVVVGIVGLGL